MRDFCKISPQFWTGKTGKLLRGKPDLQVAALYLMTSPHSNMIGIYTLPLMYFAHETGLSTEGALKALESLSEVGFCTYEGESELVWVHEMAKYQIGDHLDQKDKRCKGVQNELEKIQSPQLRKAFSLKYKDDFHIQIEGKKSKPPASPSEAPCKQEKRREGEGEGEGEGEPCVQALFDSTFWPAYPKKVGKDAAIKAFIARKPNSNLVGSMVQAIEVQRKSEQWKKENGQFIPNPATWLNEGRWQDETPSKAKASDWWTVGGFACEAEARNVCGPSTVNQFRDGQRIGVAA